MNRLALVTGVIPPDGYYWVMPPWDSTEWEIIQISRYGPNDAFVDRPGKEYPFLIANNERSRKLVLLGPIYPPTEEL